jgi:hypothetical protein
MSDSLAISLVPHVPAAGQLTIQTTKGEVTTCSGALIASRSFATAAHCLCGDNCKSYTEYNYEQMKRPVEGWVYFSAAGAFKVKHASMLPLHTATDEEYRSAKTLGMLADIAILELEADVPIPPLPLAAANWHDHMVMVSFGRLAFQPKSPKPAGVDDGPYNPGIGIISKFRVGHCDFSGNPTYTDVICSQGYNPVVPGEPNVGACQGDSGAPLIRVAADGTLSLVALESRVSATSGGRCDPNEAILPKFTLVAPHRRQLTQLVGNKLAALAPKWDKKRCRAAYFKASPEPSEWKLPTPKNGTAMLTVVSAGLSGQSNPIIMLDTGCKSTDVPPWAAALTVCRVDAGLQVALKYQGKGLVSVSECTSSTSW